MPLKCNFDCELSIRLACSIVYISDTCLVPLFCFFELVTSKVIVYWGLRAGSTGKMTMIHESTLFTDLTGSLPH